MAEDGSTDWNFIPALDYKGIYYIENVKELSTCHNSFLRYGFCEYQNNIAFGTAGTDYFDGEAQIPMGAEFGVEAHGDGSLRLTAHAEFKSSCADEDYYLIPAIENDESLMTAPLAGWEDLSMWNVKGGESIEEKQEEEEEEEERQEQEEEEEEQEQEVVEEEDCTENIPLIATPAEK